MTLPFFPSFLLFSSAIYLSKYNDTLQNDDQIAENLKIIDTCCNFCFDHLLDTSSFVRSKSLDILEKLTNEGKLKLQNILDILRATIRRLMDESVLVRRKAIKVCYILIKKDPVGNIYSSINLFEDKIKVTKNEIDTLKSKNIARKEDAGDADQSDLTEADQKYQNELKFLLAKLEMLEISYDFLQLVNEIIEILCQYHLMSKHESDIKESLNIVQLIVEKKVPAAGTAIKTILPCILSKTEEIKKMVCHIFTTTFIKPNIEDTFTSITSFIKVLDYEEKLMSKLVFNEINFNFKDFISDVLVYCWENIENLNDFQNLRDNLQVIELFGFDVEEKNKVFNCEVVQAMPTPKAKKAAKNLKAKQAKNKRLSIESFENKYRHKIELVLACLPEIEDYKKLESSENAVNLTISVVNLVKNLSNFSQLNHTFSIQYLEIFLKILLSLITQPQIDNYNLLAQEIINLFFDICNFPVIICENLIFQLIDICKTVKEDEFKIYFISRLINLVSYIALKIAQASEGEVKHKLSANEVSQEVAEKMAENSESTSVASNSKSVSRAESVVGESSDSESVTSAKKARRDKEKEKTDEEALMTAGASKDQMVKDLVRTLLPLDLYRTCLKRNKKRKR